MNPEKLTETEVKYFQFGLWAGVYSLARTLAEERPLQDGWPEKLMAATSERIEDMMGIPAEDFAAQIEVNFQDMLKEFDKEDGK